MGNRGLKASNRRPFSEPFRTARKQKQSEVQRVRVWARHTFTGEFNQAPYIKILALAFVVLTMSGGLYLWSLQPNNGIFHSQICIPTPQEKSAGLRCGDPNDIIYQATAPNGNLAEFNLFSAGSGANTYVANCNGSTPCLQQGSDTVTTSAALSNATIGDLSVASKSNLGLDAAYQITSSGTIGTNIPWGFFLTTNKTVSQLSTGAYDPSKDSSVVLLEKFVCSSNCNMATKTISYNTYFLRTLGQKDTINAEDKGCGSSGSVYLCQTLSYTGTTMVQLSLQLNFTGNTNGGTCLASGAGSGCSSATLGTLPLPPSTSSVVSTQVLPWLQLQTQQYYLGFYVSPNLSSTVNWLFGSAGNAASMEALQFNTVFSGSAPTIDTGGFFGPVIKALIAIGVFIASNIINFLSFLYNLFAPLLSGAATIIGNVLVAVMNALGTIFGDSTLGTQVSTAFTNIVNYLTNIFTSAVSIWSNILTALLNILNFITKFLSITVSGGATLFAFIESFFSTLINFWSVFVGVWNQFMKFYIAGTFTIQYILVGWWIWGIYENFSLGVKDGLIDSWLVPSQTFLLSLFRGGYWLLDEAYKFVVQLKQLIFGNRISPGTIAGNG